MPKAIDIKIIGKVILTADNASVPISLTTNSPSTMPKISIKSIEKMVGAANFSSAGVDIFLSKAFVILPS